MNKISLPHADETKTTLAYEAWRKAVMTGDDTPIHVLIATGTDQYLWSLWNDGKTVWDAHYALDYQQVCRKADRNA